MLEGKKINLRHVRKADLAELLPLLNDLRVRGEYLPAGFTSPELMEKKFDGDGMSTEEYERLLVVGKEGQLLGTVWHFKSTPYFNAREIGYILFDCGQRRGGIVSEAVRLLADYLFNSRTLNRLEIRMDTRNIGSERVAVKCGFQKEGVARGANFVQGRHVDMAVYALLRGEWEAERQGTKR